MVLVVSSEESLDCHGDIRFHNKTMAFVVLVHRARSGQLRLEIVGAIANACMYRRNDKKNRGSFGEHMRYAS